MFKLYDEKFAGHEQLTVGQIISVDVAPEKLTFLVVVSEPKDDVAPVQTLTLYLQKYNEEIKKYEMDTETHMATMDNLKKMGINDLANINDVAMQEVEIFAQDSNASFFNPVVVFQKFAPVTAAVARDLKKIASVGEPIEAKLYPEYQDIRFQLGFEHNGVVYRVSTLKKLEEDGNETQVGLKYISNAANNFLRETKNDNYPAAQKAKIEEAVSGMIQKDRSEKVQEIKEVFGFDITDESQKIYLNDIEPASFTDAKNGIIYFIKATFDRAEA